MVTGSSALVTDREPWSVRAGRWLAEVTRRGSPILAICYGHQLLADALGGEVKLNSRGRQMGVVDVSLTDEGRADPLLGVLPSPFAIGHSHRQHVLQLPEGATLLAYNANDPHAAFRLGERLSLIHI